MLWLALHFPQLALDVFAREKATQPLAIIDTNNRVLARCARAEALGIETGTTLATAHSICPELTHALRNEAAEQRRLQNLGATLYRFSNLVSLQPPDCILIEIGASLRLFGDYRSLTDEACSLCAELGSTAAGHVAATPWAAIALARSGRKRLPDIPLAQAGLQLAGVDESVIERLGNMGIHTLDPLLKLAPSRIGKRFGRPLLRYLGQLSGTLPDPREGIVPAPQFEEARHFLQPAKRKEELYSGPMRTLSNALQAWLVSHGLGAERIEWRFEGYGQHANLGLRFAAAKQQADEMLMLSELKLSQTELPEEVLGLTLKATALSRWRHSSHTLFPATHLAGQPASDGMPPTQFIDEVNARLGHGVCQRLEHSDQHTPEHAWANNSADIHASRRSTPDPSATKRRPLWLLEQPHAVRRSELTILEGPERIQSNWWQRTAARDYYIARKRSGIECWVFKDLCATRPFDERWYLHGYFG